MQGHCSKTVPFFLCTVHKTASPMLSLKNRTGFSKRASRPTSHRQPWPAVWLFFEKRQFFKAERREGQGRSVVRKVFPESVPYADRPLPELEPELAVGFPRHDKFVRIKNRLLEIGAQFFAFNIPKTFNK